MVNYVRHFNLGGTSIDIPEYDDSEIKGDITNINNQITNLGNKDSELDNKIDKEIQDRKDGDSALDNKINGLSSDIAKSAYKQNIPYPYHNCYLDLTNGSDDNDGLSEGKAFKTFDRAMNEANKWGDFRIYIVGAGTYEWSNPTLNGVTLHIKPKVDGVVIKMGFQNTGIAISIYNCHINWGDNDHRMTIQLPETAGTGSKKQPIYFENCATTLNNLLMDTHYKLDTFGGSLYCHDSHIKGNLDIRQTNAQMTNNTYEPVLDDNSLDGGIIVYNGSNVMFDGSITYVNNFAYSSPSTGASPTNGLVAFAIRGSIVSILCKVNLASSSNKFKYMWKISNSYVIITKTRYDDFKTKAFAPTSMYNNGLGSDVYYNNGVFSCLQPPAYSGMARIKNNVIEKCTGVSEFDQSGTWVPANRQVRFLNGTINYYDGTEDGGSGTWKVGKGQTRTSNKLVQCYINDTIGWQTIYDVDNPPDGENTTYVGKARYDGDVPQVYKASGWTYPNRAVRYLDGTMKHYDGGDSGTNTWKESKGATRLTGKLFQVWDGNKWLTVKDFSTT